MSPTLWIPADIVQCLQGVPQVCAVLRQLCLGARGLVLSLKLFAHVNDALQDFDAARGEILYQPAASGQGVPLTLAKDLPTVKQHAMSCDSKVRMLCDVAVSLCAATLCCRWLVRSCC